MTGMVHVKQKLAIASLLCLLVAGCAGPVSTGAPATVSLDANGNIYVTIVGPHNSGGSTYFAPSGVPAVRFAGFAYPPSISNLYAFGLAPRGTTSIETTPAGAATIEANDLFVVVIPGLDTVQIRSIHWRFLSGTGAVLAEGNGGANDDPGWGYSILRSAQPTQP